MAVYNGERFILPQLNSIISQLDSCDELVIVDDASTDHSAKIILSFKESRIRYIKNKKNLGVVRTFERAVEESKGKIIFLADQDDVWRSDKISKTIDYFKESSVVCIQSRFTLIDQNNNRLPDIWLSKRARKPGLFRNWMLNGYVGCTMAFRSELKSAILPFPKIHMHDEWIGQVATVCGKVLTVEDSLIQYRRHESNTTPLFHMNFFMMIKKRAIFLFYFLSRLMKIIRNSEFRKSI